MTDQTLEERIDGIVEEERSGFDFRKRLQNRALREDSIVLITDEVAGAAYGGNEPVYREVAGRKIQVGHRRWGAVGEVAELRDANKDGVNDDLIAAAEAKAEEAKATLYSSLMELKLRALPRIIRKDAYRRTKKALGLTTKGIPDNMQDDFNARLDAEMLSDALYYFKDHASDTELTRITGADALDLIEGLPDSEQSRLAAFMADLLFQGVIAEGATEDADF